MIVAAVQTRGDAPATPGYAASHPRVTTIPASGEFLVKVYAALEVICSELPDCCRQHAAAAG